MKRSGKWFVVLLVMGTLLSLLSGCGSNSSQTEVKADTTKSLDGQTLFVYCGAGMTKPFGEITDQFKAETGCDIQVVYANAAQIQNQIQTTKDSIETIEGKVFKIIT